MDEKQIIKAMNETLLLRYGCNMDSASPQQIYRALCYVINDMLLVKNAEYSRKVTEQHQKQVEIREKTPQAEGNPHHKNDLQQQQNRKEKAAGQHAPAQLFAGFAYLLHFHNNKMPPA